MFSPDLQAFARMIIASTIFFCANSFAQTEGEVGAFSKGDNKCPIALLSNSVRNAGSFYGIGVDGYFLLEMKRTGIGPILLYKKRDSKNSEPSIIYAAQNLTSDCQSIGMDFERVDKSGAYALNLKRHEPVQLASIQAQLMYGVPEEGEFKKIDLKAFVKFSDADSRSERVNLYRNTRRLFKFREFDKNYKDANFEKMIEELCLIVVGAIAPVEERNGCIAQAMGDFDR